MNKENVIKLTRYLDLVKATLSSTTPPPKHKNHEEQWREFLRSEIAKTQAKIDSLKLEGGSK